MNISVNQPFFWDVLNNSTLFNEGEDKQIIEKNNKIEDQNVWIIIILHQCFQNGHKLFCHAVSATSAFNLKL